MGDRQTELTVPRTRLEEITSKISDLKKWREIFSFHGEAKAALAMDHPELESLRGRRSRLTPPPPSPEPSWSLQTRAAGPSPWKWQCSRPACTVTHTRGKQLLMGSATGSLPTQPPAARAWTGPGRGTRSAMAVLPSEREATDEPSSAFRQRCAAPAAAAQGFIEGLHRQTQTLDSLPRGAADESERLAQVFGRKGLRKLLFGNVFHVFSCEWTKAYFRFREPYSDLAYALEAEKGGTRAILMAVQAHVIKYLLFVRNTEYTHLERLCRTSRREQGEALAAALADTLWAAGGGGRAAICLVAAAVHVRPSGDYKADNFTERIQLFEFSEKAAAQEFIFDHINCFKGEGSHGVILFLYSLLFSRTLERVQEDLDCTATPLLKFSFGNITCTQAVLSLLLTGRASPHELDGGQEPVPGGRGVEARRRRCPVGYLRWGRAQAERQVCRGLRTPQLPVWLCSVAGRHGVLFGTDSLLLSDWKMERLFHLYFYNGQQEQTKTAHLTIDTHSHHWEEDRSEDPSSPGKRRPSVEMAIRTKWAGATVSWNGTDPFF
ncbi:inactive ubiquitin carboxyl-terminal hydrolase MINDY-4B [Gavia stellata]|uniref:inactive ubiquitin carboxyl-terminal hydrolase MINDY-4B n=1 Tax=Gavia stellata TaxID=37040 RepID=UPI00289E65E3|nr:inactive ubiquitin carboxyl-terminal hydrolase MINDY-4B [Gavia stellata]